MEEEEAVANFKLLPRNIASIPGENSEFTAKNNFTFYLTIFYYVTASLNDLEMSQMNQTPSERNTIKPQKKAGGGGSVEAFGYKPVHHKPILRCDVKS
jgi:hypothetical protein